MVSLLWVLKERKEKINLLIFAINFHHKDFFIYWKFIVSVLRHRYLQFFEMLEDDRREINIRNTNITDILGSLTGSKVLKLVLLLPWNRNTDIENGFLDMGQGREVQWIGRLRLPFIHYHVQQIFTWSYFAFFKSLEAPAYQLK